METRTRSNHGASAVGRRDAGGPMVAGQSMPDLDAEALERHRMLAEIEELFARNPFVAPSDSP